MSPFEHAKAIQHWVSGDAGLRGQECRDAALELIRIAELNAELLDALRDAASVCNSVSVSRDRRIVRDECVLYAQTEEWCKWVEEEVGQKLISVIEKAEGRA